MHKSTSNIRKIIGLSPLQGLGYWVENNSSIIGNLSNLLKNPISLPRLEA